MIQRPGSQEAPWTDRSLEIRIRHEDLEALEEIARRHSKSPEKLAHDFIIYCIDRIEIARGMERKRIDEGRPPATPSAIVRAKQVADGKEGARRRRENLRSNGKCVRCTKPKEPDRLASLHCQRCSERKK